MTNTEIAKHDDLVDELLHVKRVNAELLAALEIAEAFMSGFEGDETQETIDEDLTAVRAAIKAARGN
jgi:hypothetical protein